MSRIDELFVRKKNNVLNVYVTAGFPRLQDTLPLMQTLETTGVDLIELGMPYSDPLADGLVIQQSSSAAIANGMTINTLFEQLQQMRQSITVPVVLMGYMNPVLQYGFERFCAKAAEVGVDGLILPDLPEFEFDTAYGPIIRQYGLDFIFLVTPETSEARVRRLDSLSSGFLYAVSASATTGGQTNFEAVRQYLKRLQSYQLNNPVLVGFGVKDQASLEAVSAYSNGAIIGSAFIKAIGSAEDPLAAASAFVQQLNR